MSLTELLSAPKHRIIKWWPSHSSSLPVPLMATKVVAKSQENPA